MYLSNGCPRGSAEDPSRALTDLGRLTPSCEGCIGTTGSLCLYSKLCLRQQTNPLLWHHSSPGSSNGGAGVASRSCGLARVRLRRRPLLQIIQLRTL